MSTPAGPGFPRRFTIDVSLDGTSWRNVAEESGNGLATSVAIQPVRAKFVRISLTANVDSGG